MRLLSWLGKISFSLFLVHFPVLVGSLWFDNRFEYNETRMAALAPKTEILYYVAFVDRGEARRIISVRRANRREVKHYVENF